MEERERKKKIDCERKGYKKETGLKENDRMMAEEISGEGDEIETQEKREKTKKTELGRGIGRDKTE